jgi:hypothetical protein
MTANTTPWFMIPHPDPAATSKSQTILIQGLQLDGYIGWYLQEEGSVFFDWDLPQQASRYKFIRRLAASHSAWDAL